MFILINTVLLILIINSLIIFYSDFFICDNKIMPLSIPDSVSL